jgi:HB1, ASXL, restriction endonuclease HTH domain
MSTLAVVEEILRETAVPMSVREIVERAAVRLPSKSKTPDTVVARDLSMDIKKKGESSLFVRTSPGRYTLRSLATGTVTQPIVGERNNQTQPMTALGNRKPAAAAPSTQAGTRARTDSDVGGGFAG